METNVAEIVETLPSPASFKVHRVMCTELVNLVDRVVNIFPEIESARPRCQSGIQSLCSLNTAIEKAQLLLQYCSESSKLYLALTGNTILLKCQRSINLLEQSLSKMQNMVPVMLAVEISRITDDLRAATFVLDASEEEVAKAFRELHQQGSCSSDSLECREVKALQLAASRLDITSHKAILIEKRSIKRLMDKVRETDQSKKKILMYLLHLLEKHDKLIIGDQTGNVRAHEEGSFSVLNQSSEAESHVGYGKTDVLSSAEPPEEEFKCPISLRVMYECMILTYITLKDILPIRIRVNQMLKVKQYLGKLCVILTKVNAE